MTDDRLRDAYRDTLQPPSDRAACPAPEELRALVERSGGEDVRLRTLDHVMTCTACRAEFDLLTAVAASRPAPPRWLPIAAAAAILIVGTGLWAVLPSGTDPEPVRGPGTEVRLLSPESGAAIDSAPVLLWSAVPEANRYRVEVIDGAGRAVWAEETRDTTAQAPPDLSAGEYRWWVQAIREDGSQAASAPRPFRLRQTP